MRHVMIDIETMSTSPRAAVLAIGAVRFDPNNSGDLGASFYAKINWDDAFKLGEITPGTVKWWMGQGDGPRQELISEEGDYYSATAAAVLFKTFLSQHPVDGVWGNGAMFDLSCLEYFFERLGINVPWSYKAQRCFRTMRALAPDIAYEKFLKKGEAHKALSGAIAQAKCLQEITRSLGISVS